MRPLDHSAMVQIFTTMDDARADWLALSRVATISPYQSFAFLAAWLETVGRAEGVSPFIVVARDDAGAPEALLPFGVIVRKKIRIASYLGGRESNFNLPLLRPGAGYDGAKLRALLDAAGRRASTPVDLYYLRNQPRRFEDFINPLAFENAQNSPSFGYGATLPATVDALAARLSKDTRKKLRRKEARLAEYGAVAYEHRARGARAADIISALIRQKSERFAVGADFARCDMPALLQRLCDRDDDGAMELHAISAGGRIVAAYAGVTRGHRFSAMLNSFDQDAEIARCSPGDLLLHALMRDLVARGMTHFDLGAGEARYKNSVCNETIELCDAIAPVSALGRVAAPMLSAYLRLKRRVKQTPALAGAYSRLRSARAA
jgi:CelD/BcsL family acetyltransferase involved in cellulose biosynthesis